MSVAYRYLLPSEATVPIRASSMWLLTLLTLFKLTNLGTYVVLNPSEPSSLTYPA